MIILSIETSCDETAISLIEDTSHDKVVSFRVLGDHTHSQISTHSPYGGVFPALAKREHGLNLIPILKNILKSSGLEKPSANSMENHSHILQSVGMILEREKDLLPQFLSYIPSIEKPPIDAIAVTVGPGLEPALWVGINFARALSKAWNIPIVAVNHMEGHIFSALLEINEKEYKISCPEFPALTLLISGGHTELVLMRDWFSYEIVGRTKDDAVGEAYDKVARILSLPYPGGPEVAKLAEEARKEGLEPFPFPRPMAQTDDLDFSFSGLKTSVLYASKKMGELSETDKKRIALGFENACADVLSIKSEKAIEKYGVRSILMGGGVAANTFIKRRLQALAEQNGIHLKLPPSFYTTDNALMIATSAFMRIKQGLPYTKPDALVASGNLDLLPM